MNRYVFEGVARDVMRGRTVIYVTRLGRQADEALQAIRAACPSRARGLVVRQARGVRWIRRDAGGWVKIMSRAQVLRGGIRGLQADVVFVDDPLPPLSRERFLPEVLPVAPELILTDR